MKETVIPIISLSLRQANGNSVDSLGLLILGNLGANF